MRVRYPVVLIVTESEVGKGEDFGYSSAYHEGLTVKGLLGDDILSHPATTHITYPHSRILSDVDSIPSPKPSCSEPCKLFRNSNTYQKAYYNLSSAYLLEIFVVQ